MNIKIYHNNSKGFTIVELLVVIVVIGVLAAITIISYTGISQKATEASLQSDLNGAANQLKMYQVDNSEFPTSLNCTNSPPAKSICLKSSPGNSFDANKYASTVDNASNPQTFDLTITHGSSNTTYHITQDSKPTLVLASAPTTPSAPLVFITPSDSVVNPDTSTTWYWADVSCNVGSARYQYHYNIDNGAYDSGWVDNGSDLSVSFTTAFTGISHLVEVQAKCYNSETSSDWSEIGTDTYASAPGCTDSGALNYDWRANYNDGSCQLPLPTCNISAFPPDLANEGDSTTLYWDSTNATYGAISGENGLNSTVQNNSSENSGSIDSGAISGGSGSNFTLDVANGTGWGSCSVYVSYNWL